MLDDERQEVLSAPQEVNERLLFSVCKKHQLFCLHSLSFSVILTCCLHSFQCYSSIIFSSSHAPPLDRLSFLGLSHAHTNRWVVAIVSHCKHCQFIRILTAALISVFKCVNVKVCESSYWSLREDFSLLSLMLAVSMQVQH